MNAPQSAVDTSARSVLDLYSLSHVEAILRRSRVELRDLAANAIRYYQPFPLRRKERPFARDIKPTRRRLIDNPVGPLKAVQSRIEERLLKRLILPEHLLGGVHGKTITHNAKLHLAARYLVTIDIKNFFPSVDPSQVRSVWRSLLNCSPQVSHLLTGLTTCRGHLPQGAPTSTVLANLVLSSFDGEIRTVCASNSISYSSWVDDLAFSGDSASRVIESVITVLMKAGFSVSHQKIRVMGPGDRKILNNLVLGRFVTVQKQYVHRVRAGIHNLRSGRVGASDVDDYVQRLWGTINYLRLFDARKAERLLSLLKQSA